MHVMTAPAVHLGNVCSCNCRACCLCSYHTQWARLLILKDNLHTLQAELEAATAERAASEARAAEAAIRAQGAQEEREKARKVGRVWERGGGVVRARLAGRAGLRHCRWRPLLRRCCLLLNQFSL